MNKKHLIFVMVFCLSVAMVFADKIKLEVSPAGPFHLNDEFNVIVSYKPESPNAIVADQILFQIADDPKIGADAATDGIKFLSGTSAKILSKGSSEPTKNIALTNGEWDYYEQDAVNALGCDNDASCVGIMNQYNEIVRVRAKVTAIPEDGGAITLSLIGSKVHNFDNGQLVTLANPEYVGNVISFTNAIPCTVADWDVVWDVCTPDQGKECKGTKTATITKKEGSTCNTNDGKPVTPRACAIACPPLKTCNAEGMCVAGVLPLISKKEQLKTAINTAIDTIPAADFPQEKRTNAFLSLISKIAAAIKTVFS